MLVNASFTSSADHVSERSPVLSAETVHSATGKNCRPTLACETSASRFGRLLANSPIGRNATGWMAGLAGRKTICLCFNS